MATIDINMSLVMIDPNEPLELYDGTIIKGRLEWFLYALCCLDYGNLPTPLSRIEEWANALITNELPNMEPQSRAEEFFKAILTGDTSNLPTPQSRSEVLLDKLARGENDFTNVEKIQSRYEFLLAYLIKNGGGIGNIDYVLYKFQKEDETLYNTKERPVKSAILKGQTLVNLHKKQAYRMRLSEEAQQLNKYENIVEEDNHISCDMVDGDMYGWGSYIDLGFINVDMLKPNTKYLVWFELATVPAGYSVSFRDKSSSNPLGLVSDIPKGQNYAILTTTDEIIKSSQILYISFHQANVGYYEFKNAMILEYQEGMENWDISYFEGMQSVQMPGLTTTGKNLIQQITFKTSGDRNISNETIKVTKGVTYTLSFSSGIINTALSLMRDNKTTPPIPIEHESVVQNLAIFSNYNSVTFTAVETGEFYLHFRGNVTETKESLSNSNIQLEEGSTATPYEPFKSNILTVNEEVELCGIGDVQDTLDCLTGEVTERIGEVVFDGTARIALGSKTSDTIVEAIIYFDNSTPKKHAIATNGLSDKVITVNSHIDTMNYIRFNTGSIDYIIYGILTNQLETVDVNGVKKYLQSNPVTIQYQLATESVKTVDLTITDQGGATIPKLKTFDKITHVNVSATDILPGVEMEVATTIGEDLSGTLYSTMEDIETKQEVLKESNNAQTESVNSTMLATTEIYESLL